MKSRQKQASSNEEFPKLDAGEFFKKSVSALDDKRRDYLSAFEILDDTGDFTARLLFADSASVIQDCIEIISDAAREYGIPIA